MVPHFDDQEPDEFFIQFEKLAHNFDWPRNKWAVLIQNNLRAKGKTTYNALSSPQSADYDYAKKAILDSHELTGEYYRVKFRSICKERNMTYTEFAHVVNILKEKCLKGGKVETLKGIKELISLEQFFNSIPHEDKTHKKVI